MATEASFLQEVWETSEGLRTLFSKAVFQPLNLQKEVDKLQAMYYNHSSKGGRIAIYPSTHTDDNNVKSI